MWTVSSVRLFPGSRGICELEVCEHLVEVTQRFLRCRALKDGHERPERLDRQVGLREVARLAGQAVVAEQRDRVQRLEQEVGDAQLRELRLKLLDQPLLVLTH